jgi:hypothetical protein
MLVHSPDAENAQPGKSQRPKQTGFHWNGQVLAGWLQASTLGSQTALGPGQLSSPKDSLSSAALPYCNCDGDVSSYIVRYNLGLSR